RRLDQVGRIRLAALELMHRERAGEARNARREVGFEPLSVKGKRRRDRLDAGKCGLAVRFGHSRPRSGHKLPGPYQRSAGQCEAEGALARVRSSKDAIAAWYSTKTSYSRCSALRTRKRAARSHVLGARSSSGSTRQAS